MAEERPDHGKRYTACAQCTRRCLRRHSGVRLPYQCPSFFRILTDSMLGTYRTSRMRIPSAFVKQFLPELDSVTFPGREHNRNAFLEGPNGQMWPVTIQGNDAGSLFFKAGWRKFALDLSLSAGDLAVFKLISETHFLVQAFGKDGCEKENAFAVKHIAGCVASINGDAATNRKRKDMQDAECFFSSKNAKGKKLNLGQNKVQDSCLGTLAEKPIILDDEEDECLVIDDIHPGIVKQLFAEDLEQRESLDPQPWLPKKPILNSNTECQESSPSRNSGLLTEKSQQCLITVKSPLKSSIPSGKCHEHHHSNGLEGSLPLKEATSAVDKYGQLGAVYSKEALKNSFSLKGEHSFYDASECQEKAPLESVTSDHFYVEDKHTQQPSVKKALVDSARECQGSECLENFTSSMKNYQHHFNKNPRQSSSWRIQTCCKEEYQAQQHPALQAKKNLSPLEEAKMYVTKLLISQRRPVSQEEREKAYEAAKSYRSSRPTMWKLMKASHVYRCFWLSFSLEFAKRYLPSAILPATLIDSLGKEWKVKWLGRRSNPGLSGGWRRFALDHCLEEGDICIFEVMNAKSVVLKVHIYRVVELENNLSSWHNHVRMRVKNHIVKGSNENKTQKPSAIAKKMRRSLPSGMCNNSSFEKKLMERDPDNFLCEKVCPGIGKVPEPIEDALKEAGLSGVLSHSHLDHLQDDRKLGVELLSSKDKSLYSPFCKKALEGAHKHRSMPSLSQKQDKLSEDLQMLNSTPTVATERMQTRGSLVCGEKGSPFNGDAMELNQALLNSYQEGQASHLCKTVNRVEGANISNGNKDGAMPLLAHELAAKQDEITITSISNEDCNMSLIRTPPEKQELPRILSSKKVSKVLSVVKKEYGCSEDSQTDIINPSGRNIPLITKLRNSQVFPGLLPIDKDRVLPSLIERQDDCLGSMQEDLIVKPSICNVFSSATLKDYELPGKLSNKDEHTVLLSLIKQDHECSESNRADIVGMGAIVETATPVTPHGTDPVCEIYRPSSGAGSALKTTEVNCSTKGDCESAGEKFNLLPTCGINNVSLQPSAYMCSASAATLEAHLTSKSSNCSLEDPHVVSKCIQSKSSKKSVKLAKNVKFREQTKGSLDAGIDRRKYFEVQRFINRRKSKKGDEFLVELPEDAVNSEIEREHGAWWVPLSHFRHGFTTCYI